MGIAVKKYLRRGFFLTIVLFSLAAGYRDNCLPQDISEPRKNYYRLEELYTKWNEGLFGSRKYYGRLLEHYLNGIIGKVIETDYDYLLLSPEVAADGGVRCIVQYDQWLTLHGVINGESLKEAVGSDKGLMKRWWRSGILLSISGKVRKFRIDTLHDRGGVDIYFHSMDIRRGSGIKKMGVQSQ